MQHIETCIFSFSRKMLQIRTRTSELLCPAVLLSECDKNIQKLKKSMLVSCQSDSCVRLFRPLIFSDILILNMSSNEFEVKAEDFNEEEFIELSQASDKSQFKFEDDSDQNYENDSEYLPSSEDESSQKFSQVRRMFTIAVIILLFVEVNGRRWL